MDIHNIPLKVIGVGFRVPRAPVGKGKTPPL